MSIRLDGRVAIVTGAGQGLGRTLGGHAIRHAVECTGLSMDDIGNYTCQLSSADQRAIAASADGVGRSLEADHLLQSEGL